MFSSDTSIDLKSSKVAGRTGPWTQFPVGSNTTRARDMAPFGWPCTYPSRMDSLQQYRLSNFCFVTESLTFMAGTQSFPALDNWYSLLQIQEETDDQWKNIFLHSTIVCFRGPCFAGVSSRHLEGQIISLIGAPHFRRRNNTLPSTDVCIHFPPLLKSYQVGKRHCHKNVKLQRSEGALGSMCLIT